MAIVVDVRYCGKEFTDFLPLFMFSYIAQYYVLSHSIDVVSTLSDK